MAQKRNKSKDDIFVTTQYFEKAGITRQGVSTATNRNDISFAGRLVIKSAFDSIIQEREIKSFHSFNISPFLFYRQDADQYILRFWVNNYRRYLTTIHQVWEELKKQTAFKELTEEESRQLLLKLLEGDGQNYPLPSFLIEFKKLVGQYYDFKNRCAWRDDSFSTDFCREYIDGISKRNHRFIKSNLIIKIFFRNESKRNYRKKLKERTTKAGK